METVALCVLSFVVGFILSRATLEDEKRAAREDYLATCGGYQPRHGDPGAPPSGGSDVVPSGTGNPPKPSTVITERRR